MSTQIQRRKGTTAQHSTFTGANAELTVDTTKKTVVVHDGATAGGVPLLREDLSNLPAGTIDNADVSASAAISGTKISPNFGSQAVTTTGTSTAASFIPTSSTVPTNGVYLPAANSVALATNGTGRLFVDSSGNVGVGTSSAFATSAGRGNISINGSTDSILAFGNGGTISAYLNSTSTDLTILATGARNQVFYTNNTERLRITSAGLVGVGTSSPSYTLDVAGTINATGQVIGGGLKCNAGNKIYLLRLTDSYGHSIYSNTSNVLTFDTGINGVGTTLMSLTDAGRLGIGTTSPASNLSVSQSSSVQIQATTGTIDYRIQAIDANSAAYHGTVTSHPLIFTTTNAERCRLDTSGRLLLGTSTARSNLYNSNNPLVQFETTGSSIPNNWSAIANRNDAYGPEVVIGKTRGTTVNSVTAVQSGDSLGVIHFLGADGTTLIRGASIAAEADGGVSTNDLPSRLVFSTTADGASSPTERMRITNYGALIANASSTGYGNVTVVGGVIYPFGSTNSSLFTGGGTGNPGYGWAYSTYPGTGASDANVSCAGGYFVGTTGISNVGGGGAGIYAKGGTGTVYGQAGAGIYAEGGASGGGGTNYASFFRTYAGVVVGVDRRTDDGVLIQFLQDGTQEGTISVSGTTVSYNGAHLSRWSQLPNGTTREEILRGTVLSNIDEMCEWGEEDNEQLNRMKVSDVEGDPNVSGVFQAWDDDDDTYTDDFYCAMTGDFIIRIADGVTVQRGDLLMSAGDGTAKPQDDDIIRSKTVAKVTSNHVTCTYDDGSYCVPCVLMAC